MDTIKHTFFYRLPFFTSIALMAASIFAPAGKTVDIHVHDTYFIIAASHYFLINGILLLFIGTLVWVTL
jgi:heme/copper-type cytochrome/quinol oxidase subunit 1